MYLHHTPSPTPGNTAASDLIKATVTVTDGILEASTTFKNRYVAVGDEIMYIKVLYHITEVIQSSRHTQITAHEA